MMRLQSLIDNLPQQGSVEWIGIRPVREAPLESVKQVIPRLSLPIIATLVRVWRPFSAPVDITPCGATVELLPGYWKAV